LVFDTSLQRSFYSSGEKTYSVFFDIWCLLTLIKREFSNSNEDLWFLFSLTEFLLFRLMIKHIEWHNWGKMRFPRQWMVFW
jgi:hypothetical protein